MVSPDDMKQFMENFKGSPERLTKYLELLLLHENASPIAYQSKGSHRRIHAVLTTHCNRNCIWCHRREDHLQPYLDREIDYSALVELLSQLKAFKMIHWAGLGEPLLYPKIFEATRLARKYIPHVMLTTNGILLTHDIADQLIQSGLTHIEVSIDGFDGKTNEQYRGSKTEEIIEHIKYLSDNSDIIIQINSVLSNKNYEALFDAIDLLKDVGNIRHIHTIPLFLTQYMIDHGIEEISKEEHKRLLTLWNRKIDEYGLGIKLWPDTTEAVMDPVITMKRKRNICFNVYENPMINIDGYIVPCGRLQHIPLDNVFELGFDDAWNGPRTLQWRREQLRGNYGALCQRECHMKNTCGKDRS